MFSNNYIRNNFKILLDYKAVLDVSMTLQDNARQNRCEIVSPAGNVLVPAEIKHSINIDRYFSCFSQCSLMESLSSNQSSIVVVTPTYLHSSQRHSHDTVSIAYQCCDFVSVLELLPSRLPHQGQRYHQKSVHSRQPFQCAIMLISLAGLLA
jgi:hypothetical protein